MAPRRGSASCGSLHDSGSGAHAGGRRGRSVSPPSGYGAALAHELREFSVRLRAADATEDGTRGRHPSHTVGIGADDGKLRDTQSAPRLAGPHVECSSRQKRNMQPDLDRRRFAQLEAKIDAQVGKLEAVQQFASRAESLAKSEASQAADFRSQSRADLGSVRERCAELQGSVAGLTEEVHLLAQRLTSVEERAFRSRAVETEASIQRGREFELQVQQLEQQLKMATSSGEEVQRRQAGKLQRLERNDEELAQRLDGALQRIMALQELNSQWARDRHKEDERITNSLAALKRAQQRLDGELQALSLHVAFDESFEQLLTETTAPSAQPPSDSQARPAVERKLFHDDDEDDEPKADIHFADLSAALASIRVKVDGQAHRSDAIVARIENLCGPTLASLRDEMLEAWEQDRRTVEARVAQVEQRLQQVAAQHNEGMAEMHGFDQNVQMDMEKLSSRINDCLQLHVRLDAQDERISELQAREDADADIGAVDALRLELTQVLVQGCEALRADVAAIRSRCDDVGASAAAQKAEFGVALGEVRRKLSDLANRIERGPDCDLVERIAAQELSTAKLQDCVEEISKTGCSSTSLAAVEEACASNRRQLDEHVAELTAHVDRASAGSTAAVKELEHMVTASQASATKELGQSCADLRLEIDQISAVLRTQLDESLDRVFADLQGVKAAADEFRQAWIAASSRPAVSPRESAVQVSPDAIDAESDRAMNELEHLRCQLEQFASEHGKMVGDVREAALKMQSSSEALNCLRERVDCQAHEIHELRDCRKILPLAEAAIESLTELTQASQQDRREIDAKLAALQGTIEAVSRNSEASIADLRKDAERIFTLSMNRELARSSCPTFATPSKSSQAFVGRDFEDETCHLSTFSLRPEVNATVAARDEGNIANDIQSTPPSHRSRGTDDPTPAKLPAPLQQASSKRGGTSLLIQHGAFEEGKVAVGVAGEGDVSRLSTTGCDLLDSTCGLADFDMHAQDSVELGEVDGVGFVGRAPHTDAESSNLSLERQEDNVAAQTACGQIEAGDATLVPSCLADGPIKRQEVREACHTDLASGAPNPGDGRSVSLISAHDGAAGESRHHPVHALPAGINAQSAQDLFHQIAKGSEDLRAVRQDLSDVRRQVLDHEGQLRRLQDNSSVTHTARDLCSVHSMTTVSKPQESDEFGHSEPPHRAVPGLGHSQFTLDGKLLSGEHSSVLVAARDKLSALHNQVAVIQGRMMQGRSWGSSSETAGASSNA